MTDDCFMPYLTASFCAITEEEKKFYKEVANVQRLDVNSNLIVWYDDIVDTIYFIGHITDLTTDRYCKMICEHVFNR